MNDKRRLVAGQLDKLVREALPRRDGTVRPAGSPRYDAMAQNRLLTAVIGVGFDEKGANRRVDREVEEGLLQRGFVPDERAALGRLLAGGRRLPLGYAPGQGVAVHYLRERSLGGHRGADVVVTLVLAGDGVRGVERVEAFVDGMERCEVAIYGGHGRFGVGPDFGQGSLVINPWPWSCHPDEWAAVRRGAQVARDPNALPLPTRGVGRKARTWFFHGCRTTDYFYNLRRMPGAREGLDLYGTRQAVYWSGIGGALLAFFDGMLRRASAQELIDGLTRIGPRGQEAGYVADLVR